MSRLIPVLLLSALAFCSVAPAAGAAPSRPLGELWTTVLETPTEDNPFVTGEPVCLELGGNTVAPFAPYPSTTHEFTCTVSRGTKIFVAASTWECSTFEGDHVGFGTTEAELLACARFNDAQDEPTVTVDEQRVPVVGELETGLLGIHLPVDNIFGLTGDDRNGSSVAHAWVVRLHPLAPGTHTIEITIEGRGTFVTTIIVE